MAMTVKLIFLVSLSLLVSLISSQSNYNATTIPAGSDGSNPLISAVEGTINVSMTCEVFRISDGVQRQTSWTLIRNGSENVNFLFTNGLGRENFENFVVVEPLREQLTILEFNSSFDNTQMGCGSGSEIAARSDLRIIRLPVLHQQSVPESIGEGNMFVFIAEETPGFPILPDSFQWSLNGEMLQNSSRIITSSYPDITFVSIDRDDSGNYSIVASNKAGTVVGFFVLDVLYGAEGVAQNSPVFVLVGSNITVIGFFNISGNPTPNSTWSSNGSEVSDSRFNILVLGQLTISSILLSDAGNYTNTLMNNVVGKPISVNNTIEIFVAERPSIPRNVSLLEIGDENVCISWISPSNIGTPAFEQFQVEVVSTVSLLNETIDSAKNSYCIDGLKPNTEYNLTIRALSMVEQLGVLASDPISVQFITTFERPITISRSMIMLDAASSSSSSFPSVIQTTCTQSSNSSTSEHIIISRSMIMLDITSFLSCPSVIKTVCTEGSNISTSGLSSGIIGGIVIASLLLLAVIGQFVVILLFFVYKTKVIKEVSKSSQKDFSALQLTDLNADYKNVDRVYDQPEHSETVCMKQNIAYGEIRTQK